MSSQPFTKGFLEFVENGKLRVAYCEQLIFDVMTFSYACYNRDYQFSVSRNNVIAILQMKSPECEREILSHIVNEDAPLGRVIEDISQGKLILECVGEKKTDQ